jgi:hypothetical protein
MILTEYELPERIAPIWWIAFCITTAAGVWFMATGQDLTTYLFGGALVALMPLWMFILSFDATRLAIADGDLVINRRRPWRDTRLPIEELTEIELRAAPPHSLANGPTYVLKSGGRIYLRFDRRRTVSFSRPMDDTFESFVSSVRDAHPAVKVVDSTPGGFGRRPRG